jgi:hypothetical protein
VDVEDGGHNRTPDDRFMGLWADQAALGKEFEGRSSFAAMTDMHKSGGKRVAVGEPLAYGPRFTRDLE